MQNQALIPRKSPAVLETSFDDLLKRMSEWSDRIAKRAYDFFASSGFTNGHDLDDWFKAERELLKPVAVEIKDSKEEFVVKAEVPGFDAKDLTIHVNGFHLIIEGKRESAEEKKEKGETIYSEQRCQQIYRSIELPAVVLADKAHAEMRNGILELKLPKAAKQKQINIAAA
jgi:HSP20 family protein